jgi:hypothetical protein
MLLSSLSGEAMTDQGMAWLRSQACPARGGTGPAGGLPHVRRPHVGPVQIRWADSDGPTRMGRLGWPTALLLLLLPPPPSACSCRRRDSHGHIHGLRRGPGFPPTDSESSLAPRSPGADGGPARGVWRRTPSSRTQEREAPVHRRTDSVDEGGSSARPLTGAIPWPVDRRHPPLR